MTPKGTVGYCSVVCATRNNYENYFIIENPSLREMADQLMGTVQMLNGTNFEGIEGSLHAAMAEGLDTGNQTAVGAAALALRDLKSLDYFWISAVPEGGGWHTTLHAVPVMSVDAARDYIENLVAVKYIKNNLTKLVRTIAAEI